MPKLENLNPKDVFTYFEEISSIPRGSGNMEKISTFCMDFAKKHNLKAERDSLNNVVIFKDATEGYENASPVILQGHLDMVCQKDEGVEIDFEKDGLDIYIDGDYVKARGTTLGADNGIAVAMIMSILARNDLQHPPIEAIFTTDEETGMDGALGLCLDKIKGRKMINIDSEDASVVTVSCAGGSDFRMILPVNREVKTADLVTITVRGLQGGHSGVEINSGRVNANMLMGRILGRLLKTHKFSIVSIDGGDKGNAIPVSCKARIATDDGKAAAEAVKQYGDVIKAEIKARESGFELDTQVEENVLSEAFSAQNTEKTVYLLMCAPNGVMQMSAEIEGLVETSLNLGILKTQADNVSMLFTLRSNKRSAIEALEERLTVFAQGSGCEVVTGGHYPSWEYNANSELQTLYKEKYKERFGTEPKIEAIHAGLECGVFSSALEGLDCISIGPEMHDIHTTSERLGITSTKDVYDIIVNVLKECKN